MEPSLQNLSKAAATNGAILGIISLVVNLIVYYVSPSSMGSPVFGIGTMIFTLILYIAFTLDLRKKTGGFWSFREALNGIFLMAFVAGIISSVLQTAFYKFVEPDAYDKIVGFIANNMSQSLEKAGMDQTAIDKTIDQVKESMRAQFNPTFVDFLKSLGIMILIEFIMSLIFAAIFKREHPIFVTVEEEKSY